MRELPITIHKKINTHSHPFPVFSNSKPFSHEIADGISWYFLMFICIYLLGLLSHYSPEEVKYAPVLVLVTASGCSHSEQAPQKQANGSGYLISDENKNNLGPSKRSKAGSYLQDKSFPNLG